jgi:hypothetical protein
MHPDYYYFFFLPSPFGSPTSLRDYELFITTWLVLVVDIWGCFFFFSLYFFPLLIHVFFQPHTHLVTAVMPSKPAFDTNQTTPATYHLVKWNSK